MFSKKKRNQKQVQKLAAAQNALFAACRNPNSSLGEIQSIVQQYPQTIKATNSKGNLPLHIACFCGLSLQVIEFLVISYPQSLQISDSQGSLALHWACFGQASTLVIQNLLLQYPAGISCLNQNHQVPLHYACHGAGRLDVVRILVQKWHNGLYQQSINGMLPLHIAVGSNNSNLELVQYLVQEYPESLYVPTVTGETPLDRARACGAPTAVVEYLQQQMKHGGGGGGVEINNSNKDNSKKQPPAPPPMMNHTTTTTTTTTTTNEEEDTSTSSSSNSSTSNTTTSIQAQLLHACSDAHVTVAQIQTLLQQDPQAIMAKTLKGMRPLHICCWKGASLQVVHYLIQSWPASVKARTSRQWIPLHVACASENNAVQLQVVECLVSHWKESIQAKDNKERIPLHIACFSRAPLPVVQYLVQEWPDSVMAMNNYASLPLHLACGTCADLNVIQFLAKSKPESLQAVDSEGRTPLDMAKQPLQSDSPDEETVEWLESVLRNLEQEKKKKQGDFVKERTKLLQVITGEKDKPVSVPQEYVETIISRQELGKGYFGVVFLGTDTVLKEKFAIKSINRKILIGGTKKDLERVKKEFKKEQKGLLRFRHPNIALLYGYCLSDSQRKGEYLLYEYAEKGSLDQFWSNQLGRERLSLFGRRAQIALDVFIGLRFLHVGNRYIKPSFHRDLKSANIVLTRDMTAQLIDCGLATFASTDDGGQVNMSTGVKGTRGYVCPKYCTGSIPFDASCDIFSFGIVLAELWSGRLQNHRDSNGRVYNFYEQYVNEGRAMDDDLDKAFGYGIGDKLPVVMNEYKLLALDCMAKNPKKRPSGGDVMDRLEIIWHSFLSSNDDDSVGSKEDVESDSREGAMSGSESEYSDDDEFMPEGEERNDEVPVSGSGEDTVFESEKSRGSSESVGQEPPQSNAKMVGDTSDANGAPASGTQRTKTDTGKSGEEATIGESTVEDTNVGDSFVGPSSTPVSRSNSLQEAPMCRLCRTYTADEGFEECLMCISLQNERDAIAKAVSSELNADSLSVQDFHYPHHAVVDATLSFSSHIDLRLNNPIPRLFGIVPEALKGGWKHPKTWLRRQVATRYNLFFICGHTFQVVRPPIKLTVSSSWIEKIALSLGVSLTLMKMAAKKFEELHGHSGGSPGLQLDQLNEMLDEVQNILKEQNNGWLHVLECIRSGIRLSESDVDLLNGEAYELIVEKAREDRDWRRVMEPVRQENNPHILWVSRIVAMDPESEYEIVNV